MFKNACKQGLRNAAQVSTALPTKLGTSVARSFAGKAGRIHNIHKDNIPRPGDGVAKEDMPFFHQRFQNVDDIAKLMIDEVDDTIQKRVKHKIPRKRASKLMHELNQEYVAENIASRPNVLQTDFRVGDAIELEVVSHGGIRSDQIEKVRGVVLSKVNKGLGASVLIRDVVFGDAVERRFPVHSPLIRSIKVLDKNFIYKGKRKVKRAKMYYVRDRPLKDCQVSKY